MSKHSFLISSLLIVLALLFAAYVYLMGRAQDKGDRQPPPVAVHAVPVKTKLVENFIEAVGTTRAFESVTITANVTEHVSELFFEDGNIVHKGDVLVELETSEERAQLIEAEARVHEAQLQLERTDKLSRRDFLSKSEHDAQVAALESARARLEQVKSLIEKRTLRAPFDGLLGFRRISKGTLVEPGDEIVTLDKIQPLKIDFSLPEQYLAKVSKGQVFTAQSIAYTDQVFKGEVSTVHPRIAEETRAVLLRGLLGNEQLLLKPGMLMQLKLPMGEETVLSIPEEALLAQGMQRYIFILDQEKKARKIVVKLLNRREHLVDIQAEIPADSWVITDGAFKLSDGQSVDVQHVAH